MNRDRLNYWLDEITLRLMKLDPDCKVAITLDTHENNDAAVTVTSSLSRDEIIKAVRPLTIDALEEDWSILIFTRRQAEPAANLAMAAL